VAKRWSQSRFSFGDEPLDTAVAVGLAHARGRVRDAEEGELPREVIGDKVPPANMAELEAAGDAVEHAEAGTHIFAQRLERLEPRRPARRANANVFRQQ
jgi:hypothetical protein